GVGAVGAAGDARREARGEGRLRRGLQPGGRRLLAEPEGGSRGARGAGRAHAAARRGRRFLYSYGADRHREPRRGAPIDLGRRRRLRRGRPDTGPAWCARAYTHGLPQHDGSGTGSGTLRGTDPGGVVRWPTTTTRPWASGGTPAPTRSRRPTAGSRGSS